MSHSTWVQEADNASGTAAAWTGTTRRSGESRRRKRGKERGKGRDKIRRFIDSLLFRIFRSGILQILLLYEISHRNARKRGKTPIKYEPKQRSTGEEPTKKGRCREAARPPSRASEPRRPAPPIRSPQIKIEGPKPRQKAGQSPQANQARNHIHRRTPHLQTPLPQQNRHRRNSNPEPKRPSGLPYSVGGRNGGRFPGEDQTRTVKQPVPPPRFFFWSCFSFEEKQDGNVKARNKNQKKKGPKSPQELEPENRMKNP